MWDSTTIQLYSIPTKYIEISINEVMFPVKVDFFQGEGFPGGGFMLHCHPTCRAEEKDLWVTQVMVELIGDFGLCLAGGGKHLSVLWTHLWLNVIKQQCIALAPEALHLPETEVQSCQSYNKNCVKNKPSHIP